MNGEARKVTVRDVKLAQLLIEKCLQLYMKRAEVVNTLHHQAKIAPGFIEHVFDKLENENQEFFSVYNMMLLLKDQIIRFNQLLELQCERMQCLNNVVCTTSATNSMNNHSAYPYQTSEVKTQNQMSRNAVVPTALANGLWTHSMNGNSAYQQEAHEVMSQIHMSQNLVVSSHLAYGSWTHSRNYSAYQHEAPDIVSQRQMSQNGVIPAALATRLLTHSRNNYSAYRRPTHEVINQTQMSQNRVVHSPFANGLQTHSMNNYSGYQHQIQMSQNGVIPTALANGSKAHSLTNYSACQDQTLVVPSENMRQHNTNVMSNFYANGASSQRASMQGHTADSNVGMMKGVDPWVMFGANNGFLESYNNVKREAASIPPNSDRESDAMTFDQAILAVEMNQFGPNQVTRLQDGMLNNYSLPPFLGNDGNFVAAQQSSDLDG